MKNAIILQGSGETQESFWLPYVKKELEKRGYNVWLPQLPNDHNPDITETLPFVLKRGTFNRETVLIGHSSGCPLILSILENIEKKIEKALLVAGFCEPLPGDEEHLCLQQSYNWKKIKNNCKDFVFINSTNDPWGCDDKQGRKMFDKLGGLLIINNEGHMGSDSFRQPYKEFPLLVKLVD